MRYYEIQNEMNKQHNSCFASKTRQNRCHRASYPHFQPAPLCVRALFRNLGDSSFCWKLLFLSLKGNFRVHRFVRAYDVKTGLSKDACHTTRLKSRLTRLSTFIRDDVSDVRPSWEEAATAAYLWAYLYSLPKEHDCRRGAKESRDYNI